MLILSKSYEFDWDNGNLVKNSLQHAVSNQECEEVFFDDNKKLLKDLLHSYKETRYIIIGATKTKRKLFIAFTLRFKKIRIISARDLNKKEYHLYEEET